MNSSRNTSSYSSSTINSNISSSFALSPLIKLERLIQRLNLILSKEFETELDSQLNVLLQYQREISKLKGELTGSNGKEFEEEDRIKWIESKEEILNKFIKDLEARKKQIADTADTEDIKDTTEIADTSNVDSITATVNETKGVSLNDILPPKPENPLLSIPKSPINKDKDSDTLVFSEEIQSQHDNLTSELIATVQLIKRNNLHIQKMVKSDEKVINEATGLLATNADAMQKESKNLKSYSKKAWVSFWKMILILMFVSLSFIFVYIFIRLT